MIASPAGTGAGTPADEASLHAGEIRRRHVVAKALVVGALAGVLASGFRLSLMGAERARAFTAAALPGLGGAVVLVGLGAGGAIVAAWLVRRFAPHAEGSGIPRLLAVLRGEAEPEWKRLIPVKFASGVVAIGSGLALGREGPTIQMGGAIGSMVARAFRVRVGEGERRALVSAGAGAGLAAAFNAPLSGLIFVLEELHGRFTPVMFVAAFLACVSADVACRLLVDELPVFHVVATTPPSVAAVPLAAVIGACAGALGVLFNRCLLATLSLRRRLSRIPLWVIAGVTGGLVGLVGWIRPILAGSGGDLVQAALAGRIAVSLLLAFLVVRFAMTMVSYASGAAGGIFAPLLVIGALGGLWFGGILPTALAPAGGLEPQVACVLGMGALFTAVVRAPLTGIVLMIELTGQYAFMLPLLAACLLAYGVAEALGNAPIYEALREAARDPDPKLAHGEVV